MRAVSAEEPPATIAAVDAQPMRVSHRLHQNDRNVALQYDQQVAQAQQACTGPLGCSWRKADACRNVVDVGGRVQLEDFIVSKFS